MTRKEKIIEIALQLFTTDGFANTPTTRIAKNAEVSEALIFRHFNSKQGLLQSCIQSQEDKMRELLEVIRNINSPKEQIRFFIQLASNNSPSHYSSIWNSLVVINHETHLLDQTFFKSITMILSSSFEELRYKRPADESQLLLLILTSLCLTKEIKHIESTIEFLLIKYNLN